MESNLRRRLQELQEEYDKGKQSLSELEIQANNLRDTLLRISGAVQVIQEELKASEEATKERQQASVVELS